MSDTLGVHAATFNEAERVKEDDDNESHDANGEAPLPRPVVIRFPSVREKVRVLRASRDQAAVAKLRSSGVSVREDFTEKVKTINSNIIENTCVNLLGSRVPSSPRVVRPSPRPRHPPQVGAEGRGALLQREGLCLRRGEGKGSAEEQEESGCHRRKGAKEEEMMGYAIAAVANCTGDVWTNENKLKRNLCCY